jgi:outer membrane protein
MLPLRILFTLSLPTLVVPAPIPAQTADHPSVWTFRTRAVLTGSSESSDPPGYVALSAFGLQVGVRRTLNTWLSSELTAAVESREVDFTDNTGNESSLGSLESVPLVLLMQAHPRVGGAVHPYLGGGVSVTLLWEKTGAFNSADIAPSIGPALNLGADLALSPSVLLNIDFEWNTWTANVDEAGTRIATLKIHPFSIGMGVGFHL